MQILLCCVISMFLAHSRVAASQLDDVFSHWTATEAKTKSLVVHFTFENGDDKELVTGTFRLLRTPKGEIFASHELREDRPNGKSQHVMFLLNDGKLYFMDLQKKNAARKEFAKGELRPFLERYFLPFVALLDRRDAESIWVMTFVKYNEFYDYIDMKHRVDRKPRFFWNDIVKARVVLMHQDTDNIPKGMPRRFWFSTGSASFTYNIESWKINPVDGPKVEDFAKPEDRPGWEALYDKSISK